MIEVQKALTVFRKHALSPFGSLNWFYELFMEIKY